jgi:diguanylate cyclase (GGDEF)-like protein
MTTIFPRARAAAHRGDTALTSRKRWVGPSYSAAAVFLAGLCVAGALAWQVALRSGAIASELNSHLFFYVYFLVGMSIVFGTAAFFAGRAVDALRARILRYRAMAEMDDLTGLLNSRAFRARYRRTVEKAHRFGIPLSLMVIDLDDLKKLNDRGGHELGNAVLRLVARAIRAQKRDDDVAARWGGDEFVLVMLGAGETASSRVAAAIVAAIGRHRIGWKGTTESASVSIGVAVAQSGSEYASLFDRADAALYAAKRNGKGEYCVSQLEDAVSLSPSRDYLARKAG